MKINFSIMVIYSPLKDKELEKEQVVNKSRFVSWAIFLAALVGALVTVTTVVFPALLVRSIGGFEDYSAINTFETGIWSYPLLVTNVILLFVTLLYLKNRLPQPITKSMRLVFNFEISAPLSFLVIIVLLGFYIFFTVPELFEDEVWADYAAVKPGLGKWKITDITTGIYRYLVNFLITASINIFGNDKVISFIGSLALLVLTYLFTTEISKKRFAGIVAMAIVLQSGTFLVYDTSVAYDNFWILFYLLSLYIISKRWPISPISFILSLLSKPLTAIYVPLTFFFVYKSSISRRKKILIAISYTIIIIIGIIFLITGPRVVGITAFKYHDFLMALNAIAFQIRYDVLVLVFILPLTIGLFVASRKGVSHADSILLLIIGMLLSQSILVGFTDMRSEQYRFMPLIIFFAVGVGTVLSKKSNTWPD